MTSGDEEGEPFWTVDNQRPHEERFPDAVDALMGVLAARADRVHVMCDHTVGAVPGLADRTPETIATIPHGSYTGWYPPPVPGPVARARLGLPDDVLVLACLGMIRPYKGVDRMLAHLDAIEHAAGRAVKFLVAGEVMEWPESADLVGRLEADARVHFIPGFVPSSDLPYMYGFADIVVLPYRGPLSEPASTNQKSHSAWGPLDGSLSRPPMALGMCIWLTGLPAAGKTTVGDAVASVLMRQGVDVVRLDGDEVRRILSPDLGFSRADRDENVRRITALAVTAAESGSTAIVSVISPFSNARQRARALVEEYGPFFEVHVDTPVEVCAARDPKGLYARAAAHEISGLTGWDAPYERPTHPDLILRTHETSLAGCVAWVCAFIAAGVVETAT